MWRQKAFVEASRQQRMLLQRLVWVNAGELHLARHLGNAVQDVQRRLYRPAHEQRGGNVVLGPVDHAFDLRPVGNIAEIDQPQRRAGDDQTVEVLVLDILEVTIEVVQMLGRRVLRFAAVDTQQLDINLQRRVGQQAQKLVFRFDLLWHQVEDQHFQRPDFLCFCPRGCHHEDILTAQEIDRR